MIKAILFDVGGVYMKGSFITFVNRCYKEVLHVDETFHAEHEIHFDADFNKGTISGDDCFRRFFKVPITDAQMEKIKQLWTSTWVLTPEMEDLVKRLKKNYTLAILSNSDALNDIGYRKKGWYAPFDHLILSHELRILKPDKRIYEIALQRLNLPAEECLFIDDQKRVLEPAKEMGMHTIQFRSMKQLKEDLRKQGITF